MPRKTLVDQLRKAIVDSGQTAYAIAQATGVSQGVLSRFLRGERSIGLETAAKLAEHLGLELTRRQ